MAAAIAVPVGCLGQNGRLRWFVGQWLVITGVFIFGFKFSSDFLRHANFFLVLYFFSVGNFANFFLVLSFFLVGNFICNFIFIFRLDIPTVSMLFMRHSLVPAVSVFTRHIRRPTGEELFD